MIYTKRDADENPVMNLALPGVPPGPKLMHAVSRKHLIHQARRAITILPLGVSDAQRRIDLAKRRT